MNHKYDVVVIGGGPAGAMSALRAAQAGVSTALLERDREIGLPVRCAEMTSIEVLSRHFSVDEKLVANNIKTNKYITPDNLTINLPLTGRSVIVERKFLDAYIAAQAAKSGAEIVTRADAVGMKMSEKKIDIDVVHQGEQKRVEANIVIAADGIESRVARWAGIDTCLSPIDLESAAQYDMVNLNLDDPNSCLYYFGNNIAPGGYLWIFPKSRDRANVGIAVQASRTQNVTAKQYLDRFIEKHFPMGRYVGFVTGGVPVARPLKEPFTDGFMVVGDAARFVNPMTGEGISYALDSGSFAGKVAGEAIKKNKREKKALRKYSQFCNNEIVQGFKILHKARKILQKIDDNELCRINEIAKKIDPQSFNPYELLKIVIRNYPELTLDLAKSFFKNQRRRNGG